MSEAAKKLIDERMIRRAIATMIPEGNVFEVRIIGKRGKAKPISGYFTDADTLIRAMGTVDLRNVNVYITLQPVNEDCYSRSQHDHFEAGVATTTDSDIDAYNWLFIDLDPIRTTDISSTQEELEEATALGRKVYDYLQSIGFSQPLIACSGNGLHLLYTIAMKNTDIIVLDEKNEAVTEEGKVGELCVRGTSLSMGYYNNPEKTAEVWHDGYYHTGDEAWRDEDGYFWYIGRADDVIKSSGYRIGPFEIENVIMELPYVLECGVSAAPAEIRGQVVKASIVLTKGTKPTDELKVEIQNYVKTHTAPYKYPRIVVFKDELPKTISGKIIRNQL